MRRGVREMRPYLDQLAFDHRWGFEPPLCLVGTRHVDMVSRKLAGKTYDELAAEEGVTRERVRQIAFKGSRLVRLHHWREKCKACEAILASLPRTVVAVYRSEDEE